MKKAILFGLLALSLTGFSQPDRITLSAPTEGPTGTISGYITTSEGKPVPDVTISLKGLPRQTATDERGYFELRHVREGRYTVEVSMIGLRTVEKTVDVKPDGVASLSITLTETERQLSEVTVTSGRRLNSRIPSIGKSGIHPMDLPQAVTVIGAATLREQQVQRLSEAIRNVNGVYLSSSRGGVQESFSARGYAFGSNNLFKNGARINPGAMPEMSALERVEVLKGSAALLFGQVAPGGIVNLVTKQPRFSRGGELSLRTGSYGLFKPALDLYGPLSGQVAYRLNGTFETAGSFRENVQSKRYYVNPSLLFRLGERTELVAEGDFLYHRFTPDFGIGTLNNTAIPDIPRSRYLGTPWQYNKTRQATATLTLRHSFSENWKLSGSLSGQDYRRDYFATERIQAAANGDWTRMLGRVLTRERYAAAQANLTGKFSTRSLKHALLAGADADHTETTNNDFSFPAVAGLPAGAYDRINILDPGKFTPRTDEPGATRIRRRKAPADRTGFYVQDLITLSPRFNLLAGVRWSYVRTGAIDSTSLLTGAHTRGVTRTDAAWSPRFGLVYKPGKATSVFASYSSSFNVNTGQDLEGRPLAPSLIDQYELGVKNEFAQGLISANLTLYRIMNSNLAQTAPFLADGTPNNNSNIRVLAGQTRSQGIEADLSAHPLPDLDITAGYSYNDARYTKTTNATGSNKAGERLVNTPRHTANASAFYSVKKWKGLRLGASVFYTGKRLGGWNNTVNQAQTYSRIIPVKGYTTIDLSAGYQYKRFSLLAKLSNLTNALNYTVHENYSINPIAPRQWTATVSYRL